MKGTTISKDSLDKFTNKAEMGGKQAFSGGKYVEKNIDFDSQSLYFRPNKSGEVKNVRDSCRGNDQTAQGI
jgi:hypothetical protein